MTRLGSWMYSPLESREGVPSCSRVIYPRRPLKSHTTKFHRLGQGGCNAARVEAADDVYDEPYPPTGPTGPHLLQTPRTRKGRRTVLFLVLVTAYAPGVAVRVDVPDLLRTPRWQGRGSDSLRCLRVLLGRELITSYGAAPTSNPRAPCALPSLSPPP